MIETVRCFVACDLSMELVRGVTGLQRDLVEAVGDQAKVRWASPATMHVTLSFLGSKVDKGITVAVADALPGCAGTVEAFDLEVAGVGAFPSLAKARVLWVGANDADGRLAAAASAVAQMAQDLGFEPEGREFSGHVTLGRVRGTGGGAELTAVLQPHKDLEVGTCRVSELVLYRSVLTPKGATYESMVRAPLRRKSERGPERAKPETTPSQEAEAP